jgi:lipopolysaccharide export LptBFGC system permease protein LptF
MTPSPNPLNTQHLTRATLIAAGLALVGIVVFVILWVILGNAGIENAPRLLLSLCVPPALIGVLVGGYFLFKSSRQL